jgi:antitoxin VapB
VGPEGAEWHHCCMALNIEDEETQKLAAEVAELTGETEAGAVREALREKKERLEPVPRGKGSGRSQRPRSMREWLEKEIWPHIPEEELDREPMSKQEKEDLLGYGPEGH